MKTYLLEFRSGALSGAFSLFKRTFLPAIVINAVMFVVVNLVFIAIFAAFGLSFVNLMTGRSAVTPGPISSSALQGMELLSSGFIIAPILVYFIIGAWFYYIYLKLNDNEIREGNNNPLSAIVRSFSSRIFTIIGFVFLMTLLSAGTLTVFSLIGILFTLIPIIGLIIMFAGYFMICIFLLRYILGLPAIVHGNMGIMDAFTFSRTHITWKRSFKIFLAAFIGYLVVMGLMILTLYAINDSVGESIGSNNLMSNAGSMILSVILGILAYSAVLSFGFSSLSALYFRYSNDMKDGTDDVEDHLVGEFS